MAILPEGFERKPDVWEVLFQAMKTGRILRAQVQGIDFPDNAPTWMISFIDLDGSSGIHGLVPADETDLEMTLMTRFIGQIVNVKVLGTDKENGLVACSRRAAVSELRDKMVDHEAGELITCLVRAIRPNPEGKRPFLSVDIGGGIIVDIPYHEARFSMTKPLAEQYKPGQTVVAKVTAVTYGNLALSIKEALPNPWDLAKFSRGQIIGGTVAHIRDNKVFIEPDICPGILGISDIPVKGSIRPGQRLNCNVASFTPADKKLRLRIRV